MIRSFLFLLAGLLGVMSAATFAGDRNWIAVSVYQLKSEEAASTFDAAFAHGVLPAAKRAGTGPVGVFKPVWLEKDKDKIDPKIANRRYVLFAVSSPTDIVELSGKLAADSDFSANAGEYLNVEKQDAFYSRIDTSLLYAFEGMPKLAVPKRASGDAKGSRLFELRIYESHSEIKGKRKVEMFNKGEIDIFKEVGLDAVFYGEAIAASNLPQLTYMLVYNDEAHRGDVWKKFLTHPRWEEMKKMDRYKDTVSKIISQHLKPLDYSQIQ